MKKDKDGTWTISCKCGLSRTFIITGDVSKESAIAQYNSFMCPDEKKDVVITITIPADKENTPLSITCNCPDHDFVNRINEVRGKIVSMVKSFAK